MKLNNDLIQIGKELLKKEDRIKIADSIGVHISTIYPILTGKRDINRSQYDKIQNYLVKCQKERA